MIDRRAFIAGLAGLATAAPLRATAPPLSPPARPNGVSLWTNADLARGLASALAEFRQRSGITVDLVARGSDVAMAALYTGQTDAALIGRPATDSERQAFEWVRQYPLTELRLPPDRIPGGAAAIRVLANHANPAEALSADQLRAALTGPAPCRWRDLGVAGSFGDHPVRIAMAQADSGTGRFLRAALTQGRSQLAWDRIREFPGDRPALIAAAVQRDPYAIGLASVATGAVRTLPIIHDGRPLAPGQPGYPFARPPYLYLERQPGSIRPAVQALQNFLQEYRSGA